MQKVVDVFGNIPETKPDAIFAMKGKYVADPDAKKVNLTVGAYRTSEGKPWILPIVHQMKIDIVKEKVNQEYLPIQGDQEFVKYSQYMAFGDGCKQVDNGRIRGVQVLSGMGGLRIGNEFIKKYWPEGTALYTSNPTWGPHNKMPSLMDIPVKHYRYYNKEKICVDFEGMCEDFKNATPGSVMLIQPCAHNPTGCDPTHEQWDTLLQIMADCKLFPFFDMAYQGFATSDFDNDAYCLRAWLKTGENCFLGQSYAKNMGLYGYRLGCFSFVCKSAQEATNVFNAAKQFCRHIWSNPPKFGAEIAKRIMKNKAYNAQYKKEVKVMSDRIVEMRQALVDELKRLGSKKDWSHVCKQIGMFSFTGLNQDQVSRCINEFHVYMLNSGRISVAGLNHGNVKHVANAFHQVTK